MDKIAKELIADNMALGKRVNELESQLTKYTEAEMSYTFQIVGFSETDKGVIIRGVFLAEGIWKGLKFVYENMKKFADMFIGTSLMKDHGWDPKYGNMQGGKVTKVIPVDSLRALAFEGLVTHPAFIELVETGAVDSISPKANWMIDESTGEQVVVGVEKSIEASLTAVPVCDFCNIFSVGLSYYEQELNNSLDNITNMPVVNDDEEGNIIYTEVSLAKWTIAYINDLPDSAFAYISAGGKKDSSGKTVPRTLRHLPYKDKDGKIDLPHLKNAIARAKQAKIPAEAKTRVMTKLQRILKRIKG